MIKKLIPFSNPPNTLSIEVVPSLTQHHATTTLLITYRITGELNEIQLLNQPITHKNRSHELWKNTCFEWFLKTNNSSKYWEFNASPTGQWNFYELESYRSHLKECSLIPAPTLQSEFIQEKDKKHSTFSFSIKCTLDSLIQDIRSGLKNSSDESLRKPQIKRPSLKSQEGVDDSNDISIISETASNNFNVTTAYLAISSVIKWKSNEISYFSLQHPIEKPDFHANEGFVLPLIWTN